MCESDCENYASHLYKHYLQGNVEEGLHPFQSILGSEKKVFYGDLIWSDSKRMATTKNGNVYILGFEMGFLDQVDFD